MSFPGPIGGDLLARRYRLIDRVGAGGMSVVWRARDEVLDRIVAVKWLGAELADDGLFRDLVRREAWATARIKHPAVAAVYDYGELADRTGQSLAYVVMEMLDGESLAERLRRGPLPWREAVAVCAEVADALTTAHAHGVVHRDISPDNVMLTTDGLRLFDFGIAAPVGEPDDDATGSTFGTPAYVAPERLDGQPAQTATDVYALGVMLFETLTGHTPFPEDTWRLDTALTQRDAPRPRVPGLPPAIASLCRRCLTHDPARRPSAATVAAFLRRYGRRQWWQGRAALAAAAVMTAMLVGLGWWALVAGSADPTGAGPGGAVDPSRASTATGGSATAVPPASPGATATERPTPSTSAGAAAGAGATHHTPTAGASATATPPTVEQALSALRNTIATAAPTDMESDIANDLGNQVQNISVKLEMHPGADVSSDVASLLNNVKLRGNEINSSGGHRLSPAMEKVLVTQVKQLNTALGYPDLA